MKPPDAFDTIVGDPDVTRLFGPPYETGDGTTVVPVAKACRRRSPRAGDAAGRVIAKPMGIFVIKDGSASWQPAVDVTRIALMGELIGLVAATLATLAMVRRPPWPDLKGPQPKGR